MYRSITSKMSDEETSDCMQRIMTAKRGLEAAYDNDDLTPSPEEKIVDMLVDLRHLCQWLGLDYYAVDNTAYQHYLEEKKEWTA